MGGTDGGSGGAASTGAGETGSPDGPGAGQTSAAGESSGDGSTGAIEDLCEDVIAPEARGCSDDVPHPECEELTAAAIDAETELLFRFAGQYTRGDSPVYDGSLSASVTGPTSNESVDGAVLAAIKRQRDRETDPLEHRFVALFPAADGKVWVEQGEDNPSTSAVSMPLPLSAFGGQSGSCVGCVPDLASAGSELALNVNTSGEWGAGVHAVELSGSLTQVDRFALTLDDFGILANDFSVDTVAVFLQAAFIPDGDEVVWNREATVRVPVSAPDGFTSCNEVTSYSAQWFFDLECASRHGVRDTQVLGRLLCCWPDTKDPGGPECWDIE